MSTNDILLIVIIVIAVVLFIAGLVLIAYLEIKRRNIQSKNKITVNDAQDNEINNIIERLGGINNIIKAESTINKVKVYLKEKENISEDKIKEIKEITGVMWSSNSVSFIIGKKAISIAEKINEQTKLIENNSTK